MATEIQLAVFHFFQDNGLSNTAKAMKKELGLKETLAKLKKTKPAVSLSGLVTITAEKKRKRSIDETDADAGEEKKVKTEEEDDGGLACMVYAVGLPYTATEDEVKEFFSECGTVVSVEQPKEPGTGRSKGNAYARFTTPEEAYKAVELGGAQGKTIGGRWLKIQMAESDPKKANSGISDKQSMVSKDMPEGCTTIFIGNLSWDVSEEVVREAFKDCGEIKAVRLATDRNTGEFKGFGHVEFWDGESCQKGFAMAGTEVCYRPIRCEFAAPRDPSSKGKGGGKGGKGKGKGKGKGDRGGDAWGSSGGSSWGSSGAPPAKPSTAIAADFKGKKITF